MARMQTVEWWWGKWPRLARARRQRSPSTIANTVAMGRPFAQRFGAQPMVGLQRVELVDWSIERPQSVRYVRTILSDAVWAGVLEENPLAGITVSGQDPDIEPPTVADVAALAAAAPTDCLRVMTLVAAYSGLRLSECAALRPGDLDAGRLFVRCGKGGKQRHSVLFEPALSTLQDFAPADGLTFHRRRQRPHDRKTVNRAWQGMRERAGTPGVRFHDLRHFHATWLLDQGHSYQDVAVQCGHLDLRGRPNIELVQRVYGHPSVEAALARIQGG